MQDNLSIARAIYDCFNSRQFDKMMAYFDPNCEWRHVPTGQTFRGPDGFRQSCEGWVTAFSDAKAEITNLVGMGDWVVCEFTGSGTHNGPLMSPSGEIAPTGKKVELGFCEVYEFKNGKVVSGRTYWDMASMLQQLGLLPMMRQAGQ